MSSQADYLAARGLRETKPEALDQALQLVLASMDPMVYDDPGQGLTAEEQAVLRRGGLTLEPQPASDPLADTVVRCAHHWTARRGLVA